MSEALIDNSSDNLLIEEKMRKEKLIDQFKDPFETSDDGLVEQVKNEDDRKEQFTNVGKQFEKKLANASQTHSAEEDDLDESSEDESPARSTAKKLEKSKSSFDLRNDTRTVTELDTNLSNKLSNNLSISITANATKDINPLKSLLNNAELLQFVVNPVPRNKVYQCTIVRDKKGLDRSLYPTYYMHLQTINSKDDNQQLKVEDFKDTTSVKSGKTSRADAMNGKQQNNNLLNSDSNEAHNRQVFLLSGRRRKKSKTYLISCNPFEITRNNSIAKLKSNVIGTQFNTIRIMQNNQRLDYATIIYETNVLGFKGPRKMTIILPKIESNNSFKQIGFSNEISLADLNKTDTKSVIKLKNKTPVWNEETQSYVLNFKGRVTQASVKNFQLEICDLAEELENRSKEDQIEKSSQQSGDCSPSHSASNKLKSTFMSNDFISMQFGRISNKEFTCDVSWPLSILQAFSIALSSFDSKLACE